MGEDDEEEDDEDDERSVAEKVDALERQFDKLRNGEIDLAGADDDSADGDASDERDADADADSTDTETTDDGARDAPDIRVSDL